MGRGAAAASWLALALAACGGHDDAEVPATPHVVTATAHDRAHGTEHVPPIDSVPHPAAPPQLLAVAPAGPPAFLHGSETDDVWIARLRPLALVRLKPIGTTSVVFRATLAGDVDVAFRPRTRQSSRGAMSEVAAYRIARALGMDQVPPAFLRTFARTEMRPRIDPDYREAWSEFEDAFIGDGDGGVPGSCVKWVAGMQDAGLDQARHVEEWTRWLSADGVIPEEKRELARDLSQLVLFDYLIGNFDRWSGGNVTVDATGHRLVIRDHNLAFLDPLPAAQADRIRTTMQRAERVSRGFVTALRALDEPRLRAALAEDPESERLPVLTEGEIAAVLERRATLLSRIGALIDEHGAQAVLYFP